MIKIVGSIPNEICVAVSGGPDSMAVLDFVNTGKRKVVAAHFNHGTEHGQHAELFVTQYCKEHNIELLIGRANREKAKSESPEEYWRNIRYDFLNNIDMSVITAHVLDDQVEQWIMTSLHGTSRLIPFSNKNIIRPFIGTTKAELISWCNRKGVPYIVDPSNSSEKYMRSYVRTQLLPHALKVNPGLFKVIRKKVIDLA